MISSFRITQLKVLAMVIAFIGAVTCMAEKSTQPVRPTVAVLWLTDETGDPEAEYWCYTVTNLLRSKLNEAKAVRILTSDAVGYAFEQFGISAGAAFELIQAQKMGEMIEAQRIVWGSYRRENEQWKVRAYVLNVASGKTSAELIASSEDWFEIGQMLTGRILKYLGVEPTEEELQKINRRWTSSATALEWYTKAYAFQKEDKPLSEQEEFARKAIDADPEFAQAHLALAAVLGSQGKYVQTEQPIRQALKLRPDSADVHLILGLSLLFQNENEDAEREIREAHRLDPDDSEPLIRLGQIYIAKGEWDEAVSFFEKARFLEPTNAGIHASLSLAYVNKSDRNKAMIGLKEAERLSSGDTKDLNAEQMICQVYEKLGEIPKAVEHYERFIASANREGVNPKMVGFFKEKAKYLKATLTLSYIEASMPKIYTKRSLQEKLQERLTKDELDMVINPVASSAEMKRWAEELTEGTVTDIDKTKAIFNGLTRRIEMEGVRTQRTAREVYAAWDEPEVSFVCQEYAKLFVALARDVKLKAFYVHVEKDYSGKVVPHDCAAVFINDRALLVDPTYRWFGVPHKDFVVLDDLQTIAHHFFQVQNTQPDQDVTLCRLASKLHPDSAWGQLRLVKALGRAEKWDEARTTLDVSLQLEPDRWDAYLLQGRFAVLDGDLEVASGYFQKALELNPESDLAHYLLACILSKQGRLKEAREEFRACL